MVDAARAPGRVDVERTWQAFVKHSRLPIVQEASEVLDMFAPEMNQYCELVQGPGGAPIGLMLRGEGESFTERAQSLLSSWHMPEEGLAYHRALAEEFEHKRAFLKLEWHPAEPIEHLASFYFRRRPSVSRVIRLLERQGVERDVLAGIGELAALLDKGSVHFVSAALRPGHAMRYKLYFSQYVTPQQHATALRRLLEVIEWFDMGSGVRDQVAQGHSLLVRPDRVATFFVSIAFDDRAFVPSVKIDYPDVPPQVCATLLPAQERAEAEAEIRTLCAMAGRQNLSYLGVRLYPASPSAVKYYADLPGPQL